MKILYIAPERRTVEGAVATLHTIAPAVDVTWASTLPSALPWIQNNRDVAAVLVEANVLCQSSVALAEHLPGIGRTAPVLVVSAHDPAGTTAALKALVARPIPDASLKQFRHQEARLLAALDHERAWRGMVETKLAGAEAARQQAEEQRARLADAQRAADSVRTTLQDQLRETETALRHVEQQRASEAAAALDRLAQRHAEFTASLAHTSRARDALSERLAAAIAARDQARQARTDDVAAAAEHLARREAELGEQLTREREARSAVEASLQAARHAEEARQRAQREAEDRHALELAAAISRFAELQTQYDVAEAEATASRRRADEKIEHLDTALREAEARVIVERTAAAAQQAERDAEFAANLAQTNSARDAVAAQLKDVSTALDEEREQRTIDSAALDGLRRREAELVEQLAREGEARSALEASLQAARHADEARQRAQREAEERHALELASAASRLAELQVQHAAAVAHAADVAADSTRSRRRLLASASALRRRTRENIARLTEQLAAERAEHQRSVAARDEAIRHVELERDTARQSLYDTGADLENLRATSNEERQLLERARSRAELDLQRVSADYEQARASLDQVRAAFHTLEGISTGHALQCATLESLVAARDEELSAQHARHLADEQAWKTALDRAGDTLRTTVAAGNLTAASLHRDLEAVRRELHLVKIEGEALRSRADDVPVLRQQLAESQQESRRQFENAPYATCRFTRDGRVVEVNRAVAVLLGYRSCEAVRQLNFATTVFEAPADLTWLIDRAASGDGFEPVETAWRRKDRSRVTVRLHLIAATPDVIEIAAEDQTRLRAVEESLRHARRLEAVGRLASEVAVTCDTLLRDVSQDGQQWLAAIDGDAALRQQGELLLGEVTRAAGFLRQFASYGHEQIGALEPVNLRRVLRNLEPVLKRVAGDDIDVVLPAALPSFDLDVERERVERVLVNVASYARARMPNGGRLRIDLAETIVDRGFIARYPSVRPGAHALITVTEERAMERPGLADALRDESATADSTGVTADRPGVDLSALLRLLADCGGHLWVTAERCGDMSLKIHLPLRVTHAPIETASLVRVDRGAARGKWFRH
jgi:hypothetical protein